jgi:transcriptional regulator with XRE-family HTH domain
MNQMNKDELYEVFRQNLRSLRIEAGMSQSELARRMDVKPSYICDLENSRRPGVTIATVAEIADVLGVAPSTLLSVVRTQHAVLVTH